MSMVNVFKTMSESQSITMAAAKFISQDMMNKPEADPVDIANKHDLWLVDEWTHVGMCVLVCLENEKLVNSFAKNPKVLDALLGKVIKFANKTVDPELIKELLPLVIKAHFSKGS